MVLSRAALFALIAATHAFQAPITPKPSSLPLHAKKSISPNLKAKLLQEAESPWRTVRKFIYGAFALRPPSAASTALTQLAAAVSKQPDALPLEQTIQNVVVVDFGVVAACAYGAKVDGAADSGLEEDDGANSATIDDEAIAANLATLQKLEVTVAGERVATVETLRTAANQACRRRCRALVCGRRRPAGRADRAEDARGRRGLGSARADVGRGRRRGGHGPAERPRVSSRRPSTPPSGRPTPRRSAPSPRARARRPRPRTGL